ncbi:hypothetical protein G7046_g7089 [Stylonectria norvegica]|nr:hypothetical protein G7046_g7089 [Stylonectria norvegica]
MAPMGLNCSICNVSFESIAEQRQHDSHVTNLRTRVAASGQSDFPGPQPGARRETDQADNESSSSDDSASEDNFKEDEIADFQAQNCLFCPNSSTSFDENLRHMKTVHGLTIPYQDHLAVDAATLIWYLHLVIFAYRECLACGKRRHTVEGVQQHMLGNGHCRFDISDEMEEFYDLEGIKSHATEPLVRPDSESLRLPSGNIISHRSPNPSSAKPRPASRRLPSTDEPKQDALAGHAPSEAVTTKDRKDVALGSQLSRLSVKDQQSLMHLPDSAQRSFLVQRRKEFDTARRAKKKNERRVEPLRIGHEKPGTHAFGTHGGTLGAYSGR